MFNSRPAWFPKLSRRAWSGLGCVYLATLPLLYVFLPIRPSATLHTAGPVAVLGFGDGNQKLVTIGCNMVEKDGRPRRRSLRPELAVWDLRRNQCTPMPVPGDGQPKEVVLAPDGVCVAIRTQSYDLLVYDLVQEKSLLQLQRTGFLDCTSFSPGGTWFMAYCLHDEWNEPVLVNLRTGATWKPLAEPTNTRHFAFAFLPDEESVVLLREEAGESHLERWDLTGRRCVWSVAGQLTCLALAPDGAAVAAQEANHACTLFDAATGERQRQLSGLTQPAARLLFDRTSQRLSAIARLRIKHHRPIGEVVTWDVRSGAVVVQLDKPEEIVLVNAIDDCFDTPKCMTGADAFLNLSYRGTGRSEYVRLADGSRLQTPGYVTQVSPDARFMQCEVAPGKTSLWLEKWLTSARWNATENLPAVIHDLHGWGRTIVLPEEFSLKVIATFSTDSTRVATQTADHRTIHVWDLPARPALGEMLLWSLMANGLLLLIAWRWSRLARRG